MSKRRVADSEKRIVIGARVTSRQKATLLAVGRGNISGGLDKIMVAMQKMLVVAMPSACEQPPTDAPAADRRVSDEDRRIVINARVTPRERDELTAAGEGNISRGLDRLLVAIEKVWESAPPRPDATTPAPPSA